MGFLRTILILLLIYYAVRFFNRHILPLFVRNYLRKNGGDFLFRGQQRQNTGKRNAGDIDIDYVSKKSKKVSKDTGEYVDFEEVKD